MVTAFVFNGVPLASPQIANAGKVRTRGIEADFTARPTRNLTIGGNASYIDAKFAYFPNGTCNYNTQPGCFFSTTIPGTNTPVPRTAFINNTGKVLPNSPKYSFVLNASYDLPLSDAIVGFLRANYSYRSAIFFSANNDALTKQGGFGIAGGQIGVHAADGRWSAAVFARNLFDRNFLTTINNTGIYQGAQLTSNAQRTVGVLLDVRFGPR